MKQFLLNLLGAALLVLAVTYLSSCGLVKSKLKNAAATTYTYTGSPFTASELAAPTVTSVTGSFTTGTPLPPNYSGTVAASNSGLTSPVLDDYSFSDGVTTYANTATGGCGSPIKFSVQTDDSGTPVNWDLQLSCTNTVPVEPAAPAGTPSYTANSEVLVLQNLGGIAGDSTVYTCSSCGSNSSPLHAGAQNTVPGTWSVQLPNVTLP